MNSFDIAKALVGSSSSSYGTNSTHKASQTTTIFGTATSDSENGKVRVLFDGDSTGDAEDGSIEVSTTFFVNEGDTVIVSLIGADGTGKYPIVVGVEGRGDEQQDEIKMASEAAEEALEAAEDAQEVADNAIISQVNYYILSASAPSTPTEESHSGWSTTEPVWSATSSDGLYMSVRTVIGNGTITWSTPVTVQAYADINIARNAIISNVSETYVAQGDSNIETLSSTMKQDSSGVNIFNDISTIGDTYAHIDGEAFEIKSVIEAEAINSHLDKSVASFGLNRANIAGIDGTKYWAVEDLRTGSGGTATMSQLYYGDSETTDIIISFQFVDILSVIQNDIVLVEDTDYTIDATTNSVIFETAPLVGDSILITYTTTDPVFAYTNGLRGGGEKGPYSISNGLYNIARGAYSEAHGNLNIANGYASYVEGYNNIASGEMQRVFGKSNIEDKANKYIEIVGNGEIIPADSTETFLINDETTLTLAHTPTIVNTAYVGKTYLYAEISEALTAHNVHFTYRSKPGYDASGNLVAIWCYTTLKATTPFDYAVTFLCKDKTSSGNPKTITLNAGKTSASEVGITTNGVNNYSVYSATIPTTDVIDFISIDADEVSLSGEITYFGQEFGDFPLIINYTYAGSMVRGNARTLDWHGNENIAGNFSNPYGIAPVFQLLWINSAPESNFAAQTISLNLSSYDAVCIITKTTASSSYTHWQFGLVGGNMTMANKATTSANQYGRTAQVAEDGITFSNGYNGSTAGAANCIPWYIYGIKGLQTSIQ